MEILISALLGLLLVPVFYFCLTSISFFRKETNFDRRCICAAVLASSFGLLKEVLESFSDDWFWCLKPSDSETETCEFDAWEVFVMVDGALGGVFLMTVFHTLYLDRMWHHTAMARREDGTVAETVAPDDFDIKSEAPISTQNDDDDEIEGGNPQGAFDRTTTEDDKPLQEIGKNTNEAQYSISIVIDKSSLSQHLSDSSENLLSLEDAEPLGEYLESLPV